MANIIFDWDGTIAKPDVALEASIRRLKMLGHAVDHVWLKQAVKTNDHFTLNTKLISRYTGVVDPKELNSMMTDMFKLHYLAMINELKEKALYDGMRAVIKQLHAKKHRLVIASTIRSDIIKHALKTLALEEYFEKVYANTADLRYSKRDVVQMANKNLGKSDYMIGDKEEDILSGQAVKAKAIYVTWGATGTDFAGRAEFTVASPSEILNIIK